MEAKIRHESTHAVNVAPYVAFDGSCLIQWTQGANVKTIFTAEIGDMAAVTPYDVMRNNINEVASNKSSLLLKI
jgi:hypothetical protein